MGKKSLQAIYQIKNYYPEKDLKKSSTKRTQYPMGK
jgi:hypothetical protein